ncbi:hypothetical protein PSTG_18184 [Puccinia striiformis f. sp. tritici PST-78]|uniref:Uncharacterized protein n=1 Tax=Puccinia striiformis f. sp. tritici PST-78 TaxID=1165861 RepID=A0A0L0UN66_9BASI|nr:hypothetical protein PSTG_18184 [Puccinia striiformis f. sp. tritici PST-78]
MDYDALIAKVLSTTKDISNTFDEKIENTLTDRRDAPLYDPDMLIKPDEHDPEYFLYFHSTGEVRARSKPSEEEAHCASETIRVFGLDNNALEGARANAVRSYRKINDGDLAELASWGRS